jgi:short-subunit dehydrogenase
VSHREAGARVDLAGARVLLTGQAIAHALAARGARLVVSGRRPDVLAALARETGAAAIPADLADAGDVERLAREAGEGGPVDVLVANAALPASGRLAAFSVAEMDRAVAVNLRAPMVLARLLTPAMAERGRGHVVLLSSLAGKAASGGGSVYSATKFGIRGFAQGLREDLRPHGVGVSCVMPGFIRDAGMFHESGARLPAYVRTKRPADVAAAVIEAIERDRGEIDVAPLPMRAGATVASLVPDLSARVQRRLGGDRVAAQMIAGQASKR